MERRNSLVLARLSSAFRDLVNCLILLTDVFARMFRLLYIEMNR